MVDGLVETLKELQPGEKASEPDREGPNTSSTSSPARPPAGFGSVRERILSDLRTAKGEMAERPEAVRPPP